MEKEQNNELERIIVRRGKKYKVVFEKCSCDCHKEGVVMMHFVACCHNGLVEKWAEIKS